MLKKSLLLGVVLSAAAAMTSMPASAGTVVASGTITTFSGVSPVVAFSVPETDGYWVTITDCCITGDYYATYVDGAYLGTTPYVPIGGPTYSSGTFYDKLTAGGHGLQIVDQTLFAQPAGASYSISTPEPSTWVMMGLGFAALGFAGYRQARKTAALPA